MSTTIFDDVYRSMAQNTPKLMIPVINEVFDTEFSMSTPLEQLRNEFFEKNGKVITDSIFRIEGFIYHLECQSTEDAAMVVRMFRYDTSIAIEEARKTGTPYKIKFPKSAVIYLKAKENAPKTIRMEVEFPNGQTVLYEVETVRIPELTLDEIFDKDLLIYIPYYIMRYEKSLDELDKNMKLQQAFYEDVKRIATNLESKIREGISTEYISYIWDYTKQIAGYILNNKPVIRKGVDEIMGGEILHTWTDDILELGREKGREEGSISMLYRLVTKNLLSAKDAAEQVDMTEEEFMKRLNEYMSGKCLQKI